MIDFDLQSLLEGVFAFYLSLNVLGAAGEHRLSDCASRDPGRT